LRAFPHQLREVLAESVVHLVENLAGRAEHLRKLPAHADGLRPLSRKDEGPRHPRSLLTVKPTKTADSRLFCGQAEARSARQVIPCDRCESSRAGAVKSLALPRIFRILPPF